MKQRIEKSVIDHNLTRIITLFLCMQILLNHLLRPHLILGFKSDSLLIGFTQKCICENTTINLQKCIETRHVVRKKVVFFVSSRISR